MWLVVSNQKFQNAKFDLTYVFNVEWFFDGVRP